MTTKLRMCFAPTCSLNQFGWPERRFDSTWTRSDHLIIPHQSIVPLTSALKAPSLPIDSTVFGAMDVDSHGLSFPEEVFHQVLLSCSPLDLYRVSQCNRSLRRLATASSLWEDHYYLYYKASVPARNPQDAEAIRRHRRRRRTEKMRAWIALCLAEEKPSSQPSQTSALPGCSLDELLGAASSSTSQSHSNAPDFYRIFSQRMNRDVSLMRDLRRHLELTSRSLRSAANIVATYGDDARQLLQCLIQDQQIDEDALTDMSQSSHLQSKDATDDWPTAYGVHTRIATRQRPHPSLRYCISLSYHASAWLSHLQRREAITKIRRIRVDHEYGRRLNGDLRRRAFVRSTEVEESLQLLALFRGGEVQELSEYFDLLALHVYLRLVSEDSKQAPRDTEASHSQKTRTRHLVLRIVALLNGLKYGIADPITFLDLDNSFLHISTMCPQNRKTLPLTMTVIFCAVARRLGIAAAPCDTPGRILAVVADNPLTGDGPQTPSFYVDSSDPANPISESKEISRWTASIYPQFQGPESADGLAYMQEIHMSPASAMQMMMRSARNILNAVQNGRGMPRVVHVGANAPSEGEANIRGSSDDASNGATTSVPSVLSTLETFLSSHPASALSRNDTVNELGILQPLHPSTAHVILPTHRRGISQPDEDEDALFCSAWVMTELGDELGQRGRQWIITQIGQSYELDVMLIPRGEEYARAHGVQYQAPSARTSSPPPMSTSSSSETAGAQTQAMEEDEAEEEEEEYLTDSEEDDRIAAEASTAAGYRLFAGSLWSTDSSLPTTKHRRLDVYERITESDLGAEEVAVRYHVGTLFTHRSYGYRAVILGWDVSCEASLAWQSQMGVDVLPGGGKDQPFYNVLVDDGSRRYVAECNVVAFDDSLEGERYLDQLRRFSKLLQVRGLGKHFRSIQIGPRAVDAEDNQGDSGPRSDCTRLLKTARMELAWPDD